MAYVCLRLKATKSTALTSTVSFNILVLVFVEADFFRFFRNFLSWKNVSLTLVGLIVLEIYLRVESRHSPRRKLIDFEYVKNFYKNLKLSQKRCDISVDVIEVDREVYQKITFNSLKL